MRSLRSVCPAAAVASVAVQGPTHPLGTDCSETAAAPSHSVREAASLPVADSSPDEHRGPATIAMGSAGPLCPTQDHQQHQQGGRNHAVELQRQSELPAAVTAGALGTLHVRLAIPAAVGTATVDAAAVAPCEPVRLADLFEWLEAHTSNERHGADPAVADPGAVEATRSQAMAMDGDGQGGLASINLSSVCGRQNAGAGLQAGSSSKLQQQWQPLVSYALRQATLESVFLRMSGSAAASH
jgi:hypothetical protein